MSPGHDDEILPADFIDRRIGLTAGWQKILPKRRSGIDIDGADKIVRRRGDEDSLAAVTTAPPLFGVPFAGLAIAQRMLFGAWNRFCQLAR